MSFNESFIRGQRGRGLFGDPCCTEVEWLFLEHCRYRKSYEAPLDTLEFSLDIDGVTHQITTFQKFSGIYRSMLITQSSHPDLEGMVIRNLYHHPQESLLRYLHANVIFLTETLINFTDLSNCEVGYPTHPGDFINELIFLMQDLGQPVGEHFLGNTLEFSNYVASEFPQLNTQWPTHLGYIAR